MVLPPAIPAADSKATVNNTQQPPIIRQSFMPQPFTNRGSISHVIKKMNMLSNIPLTSSAVSSPKSLTSTYSRNPPLSIARGMKHIHTINDFNRRIIFGMRINCDKISIFLAEFVIFHSVLFLDLCRICRITDCILLVDFFF